MNPFWHTEIQRLMNYGRPNVLKETILPALLSYKAVAQVIVSHGKESTDFSADFAHPKVKHRLDWRAGGLNDMLGVALRFKVGTLDATQPWVLIMDDDILPSEASLDALLDTFAANPNRIVGKWGRSQHLKPVYDTVDVYGVSSVWIRTARSNAERI